MIVVTPSAIRKLMALLVEHPEDQVVRIVVKDLDDHRLAFGLTLEEEAQPGDEIQVIEGLTVAIEKRSAPRMDGMTMDYREPEGFRFLHSSTSDELTRAPSSSN
jgi:Fe-S cluster assembly iron-binding protein IscA